MFKRSLQGVRVVDFSHVLAGPVCTMMLADMGAEVIKIEPPGGELGRQIGPPWIAGESAVYLSVNRNKRGMALDLKSDGGREVARRLINRADVVVENYRPGVMQSFGLDYDTLADSNRGLVYCSISAYGQTGPLRGRPGVDGIIQAASGLMSTLGIAGGEPVKVATPVADMVTAYIATIAILAACNAAQRSGQGEYLDISLYNATLMLQQIGYASFFASDAVPAKAGSAAPYAAPNEAYQTLDGWIMVAAYHPQRWQALCAALGAAELEHDPRFASNECRVAHREELRRVLTPLFRQRATEAWVSRLSGLDILCAPVANYDDVVRSQEYAASGIDSWVDHPVAGKVRMPGFAPGPAHAASAHDPITAAPTLGQHSRQILNECGYDTAEIDAMFSSGVLGKPERFST
ncbi:CoA transferase [Achromobacter mucicolens]|uniref:CaiB/BaiF CoA transferase family protein n=1 Tax=Achromobacter TaxID=222 RepID=UPI00114F7C67|nr:MULTISPECIES: CoA transferase [Achromobacter]MCU6619324.1 CoA transferase [Achromobacter mucicolens]TQJ97101.1 crotonobetainyl-CoA:carnitine CoA-transferase CaiB-like acyl-CoA transferase [Achromobacter sp. SLBN-14]UDG74321.1 CoA transferase [Achromobacter sp. 77]